MNSDDAKVGVVIPCHNAERYLAQTLASLLAQTRPADQIVLVDDGSTDQSLAIAAGFGIACVSHQAGRAAATRNVGFFQLDSNVDAVMFLDADDVLGPTVLATLLAELPEEGLAIGPWVRLEMMGEAWTASPCTARLRRPGEAPLDAWLTGWYAPPCAQLWSAATLRSVGLWDERALSNDDGELVMRSLAMGATLVEADGCCSFYRRLPDEASSLSGKRAQPVHITARVDAVEKVTHLLAERGQLEPHRAALREAYHLIAADARGTPEAGMILDRARRLGGPFRKFKRRWPTPTFSKSTPVETVPSYPVPPPAAPNATAPVRPTVSIIVPTFNRAHFLHRSVGSAIAQTFEDFELLVVDDASTDETAQVLADFADPRLRHLRQPTNRGVAEARNRGLREARGRYVAFLDSDDAWFPTKLAEQIARFETLNDDVGMMQCGFETRQPDGQIDTWQPEQRGDVYQDLLVSNVLHGSSVTLVIRRSVIAWAGFFDPTLPASEDWDYWIRITRRHHVDFVPTVLARYHNDEQVDRRSLGKQKNLQARAMIEAKHRAALREVGRLAAFRLETARRALLPPDPDRATARRLVRSAVIAEPMSRTALGAWRRQLLGKGA